MKQEKNRNFHSKLKSKMDKYAFNVYKNTKKFPKDELFGIVSQLRRSALSVILNYIEGYARLGEKQYRNFLLMSFGSLKESKYLLFFSYREGYLEKEEYNKLLNLADEIGAMLWTTIQGIKRD
ncbi:MAG: four helix bundle protein [Parcubacteria group bacterium]|jgi:four helix bundle protein|nr:four helix bundle protein [Bacteroidales bacterium]